MIIDSRFKIDKLNVTESPTSHSLFHLVWIVKLPFLQIYMYLRIVFHKRGTHGKMHSEKR